MEVVETTWCMAISGSHENYYRQHRAKRPTERQFGLTLGVLSLVATSYAAWRGSTWSTVFAVLGAILLGFGLFAPLWLKELNNLWNQLGLLIGKITTPVVLLILYFGFFTPMGWLFRKFSKQSFQRQAGRCSQWHHGENNTINLKNQF